MTPSDPAEPSRDTASLDGVSLDGTSLDGASLEGGRASAGLDRTANVLGALALVVSDRTADAIASASGQSATGAAALSALRHFLDRPTIDLLRQVLGLTSSGTVRLVDRLVQAGCVRRTRGPDARSTAITLTEEGERTADRVAAARAEVLSGALARLPEGDRRELDRIMGELLGEFVRGPGATRWICRLCHLGACGRDEGHCPTANAVRARYPESSLGPVSKRL